MTKPAEPVFYGIAKIKNTINAVLLLFTNEFV
jgi:hypothetical protein